MMSSLNDLPEQVAAVDLGSNSFHMVVARTNGGEPVIVDRMREMVQLAAGLDSKRRLRRAARHRALSCLERFGQRVGHMSPSTVRAVGTNTLRSSRNSEIFLSEAEAALGHSIETISGMEEARLIWLGVHQTTPSQVGRRLVLDIGGGSTEIIVGQALDTAHMESLYLGCVSMSRTWFPDGDIDPRSWKQAMLAALREFEPVQAEFREIGWDEAIGASGTVRAIEAVARAEGWSHGGITSKVLMRLRRSLLATGSSESLQIKGLNPARQRVFPGGVVILSAAFEALGIERMQPSDGALREGLLWDLLGRIREEDVRDRTIAALGNRYHVDWKQAERVESTALGLLKDAAPHWKLEDKSTRQLLAWAARVHEVGLDIAHAHYHRHGEYILGQSDLFGFSREEQLLLATLVRGHRQTLPVPTLSELRPKRAEYTERLIVLLRLAAVLHRSRSPDPLPDLAIEVGKRRLSLTLPKRWLEQHALTRTDLALEASYLDAIGFQLDFS